MTRSTLRWRCVTCDHISTSFAAAERHAINDHPGARIETLFQENTK